MFCMECKEDHPMKFIITESNKEKEVWRCRKCGYQEELEMWQDPNHKKKGK